MRLYTFLLLITCMFSFTACQSQQETDTGNGRLPAPEQQTAAGTTDHTPPYSTNAVTGQTLYVPVYSHIYQQNRTKTFNLTATLSIRNTSMRDTMEVHAVQYYNSEGRLVRSYQTKPRSLGPLSSIAYVIDEDDLTGGIGANFIVRWSAQQPLSDPLIEAVMISTSGQQGISFTGTARVIDQL